MNPLKLVFAAIGAVTLSLVFLGTALSLQSGAGKALWTLQEKTKPVTVRDASGQVLGAINPFCEVAASDRPECKDFVPIRLSEISSTFLAGLILVEDARFFVYHGVDPGAAPRLLRGAGGSTLAMQTVKNAVLLDASERGLLKAGPCTLNTKVLTVCRKATELILAPVLRMRYGERESLELMLSRGAPWLCVDASNTRKGIFDASYGYFRVHPSQLTAAQSMFLVSTWKTPGATCPKKTAEADLKAMQRVRNDQLTALLLLRNAGVLSQSQYEQAVNEPLQLEGWRIEMKGKQVTRAVWLGTPKNALDMRYRALIQRELHQLIDSGRLKTMPDSVTLSIDPALQQQLDAAVRRERLPSYAAVGAAVVGFDGSILALTSRGGRRSWATTAQRPIASTGKALIYGVGFENGLSPQTTFPDRPFQWHGQTIRNVTRTYSFRDVSIANATVTSLNTVAVAVEDRYHAEITETYRRAGLVEDTTNASAPALGNKWHSSPLNMARLYASFGAQGQLCDTHIIASASLAGKNLNFAHPCEALLSPQSADQVTQILRQAVTSSHGHVPQLRGARPIGAKTGTSEDYADLWLSAVTDQAAISVWVGDPDQNRSMHSVYAQQPAVRIATVVKNYQRR